MTRIEFRLSMPGTGSWDGRWSGEGRNYVLYRTLTPIHANDVMDGATRRSWHHRWDDGWAAMVTARVMDSGERRQKSDGFSGYDWMVAHILTHGEIDTPKERAG